MAGEYIDPRTNQQSMMLLRMGDLSTQEKMLAQQQAQVQQLRGLSTQPSSKMDWASQASRGLQGLGAGFGQKKYAEDSEKFSLEKQRWLEKMEQILMQQQRAQQPPPQLDPLFPPGYQSQDVPPGGPY